MAGTRRRTAALVAVLGFLLLLALLISDPFARPPRAVATVPTGWARIVRTNVVERQQVSGTLDYSGSFAVADAGPAGVVTWLPSAGSIVRRGRQLYALDRLSTRLLYGARAASRDLSLGIAPGADVRQLQENLRALGFTVGGALHVTGLFDPATLAAVEDWQRSLGEAVTGRLPLGSVVFLPGAVRIASLAAATGGTVQAGGPILSATSAVPVVLVPLDPGTLSQLSVGDPVLVTLPDGTTSPGRVADIGRVATAPPGSDAGGGGGGPTVPVTVTLDGGRVRGGLDQAPVQVAITEQEARRVLAVPISALLAEPGGGYAVTVGSAASNRLVPVTTGLFDDVAGRVQISGAGLAAGMRVQVPSQ